MVSKPSKKLVRLNQTEVAGGSLFSKKLDLTSETQNRGLEEEKAVPVTSECVICMEQCKPEHMAKLNNCPH
jgi:hypothetical protein